MASSESPVRRVEALLRRRLLKPIAEHQVAVIMLLWATTMVLGYVGWLQMAASPAERVPVFLLYRTLQLFPLKSGDVPGAVSWQFEVARWLAPVVVVIFAGKGLSMLFYRQFQYVRAARLRNHVVVCGLGEKGAIIAKAMRGHGLPVVVVEERLGDCAADRIRGEGVILVEGDARSPGVLRAVGVGRARYVVAVCDDATNAEIVVQVGAHSVDQKSHGAECLAHVQDPSRLESLYRLASDLDDGGRHTVRFFSLADAGAREMLRACPPFSIDPENEVPTIVVLGAGAFAERFILGLAERWAIRSGLVDTTLPVTLIAPDASRTIQRLSQETPVLTKLCSFKCIDSGSVQFATDQVLMPAVGGEGRLAFYVLDESEQDATCAAARLDRAYPDARTVVLTRTERGLARLMAAGRRAMDRCESGIAVFPLYEKTCGSVGILLDAENELLARLLSQEYIAITGSTDPRMRWDTMPPELRESNVQQARWIPELLAAEGYRVVAACDNNIPSLELERHEIESLASREHRRWDAERKLAGWRLSTHRDVDRQRTPYLQPWEALDESIKEIDRRFVASWPRLLAHPELGFRLERGE